MQNGTFNAWPIEDTFGICRVSLLPVYASASIGSVLVSQLLYGETYRLLKVSEDRQWLMIESERFAGSGWIRAVQHDSLGEEAFHRLQQNDFQVTLSAIVTIQLSGRQLNLLPGSNLYFSDNELFDLRDSVQIQGAWKSFSEKYNRDQLVNLATAFVNTPLFYGGRSLYGLSMAAFVHLVYKQAGYTVPAYLSSLLDYGTHIDHAELLPGDLVVFKNLAQIPDRVGMYLGNEELIEMHGALVITPFNPDKAVAKRNICGRNQVHEFIKLVSL